MGQCLFPDCVYEPTLVKSIHPETFQSPSRLPCPLCLVDVYTTFASRSQLWRGTNSPNSPVARLCPSFAVQLFASKMIVPLQDHLAASRWLLELPAWWVVSRSCVKSSLGLFFAFLSFLTSASLPFKMFKEPCNLMSSVSQRLGGIAWVCNLTFEHWGAPWTTNQPIQTPARHKAAAGSAPACGRNLAWRIFF